MKLLEGIPSATEHRPAKRRPVVTLVITGVALVLAAALGIVLVLSGGNGDNRAYVPPTEPGTEVAMSAWVSGVDAACTQTVQTHPILAEGSTARTDPANVAAVDVGTRDLATHVRDVERPTATDEADRATEAVQLGDQADQQWYALAALPAADITEADLVAASDAVTTFTTRLGELGAASCSALG